MAVESLNEKFTELLDKFDQLNVNNQHIVERLNRLETDAVPASNTGGVKKKTALLGASPCGDLEQQTVKDTKFFAIPGLLFKYLACQGRKGGPQSRLCNRR